MIKDSTKIGSLRAFPSWQKTIVVPSIVALLAVFLSHATSLNAQESKPSAKENIVKPTASYKPAAESSQSKLGKQLFKQHNCAICHSTGGSGGCLGPPLQGVGARRSKEFLLTRIRSGKKAEEDFQRIYGPELLEHPRFPAGSAQAIVAYLLTLPEPAQGFKVSPHMTKSVASDLPRATNVSDTEVKEGKKLFFEKGCAACHSIQNLGGQFAAPLDGISKRKDRRAIEAQMSGAELLALPGDQEYGERGTIMPPSNLSPAEIMKITDFLLTVPEKGNH